MANPSTSTSTDLAAKVADIEFVRAFEDDVRKLSEVLDCFTPVKHNPGTALKYYDTVGTLQSGTVAEGENIPLSKYTRKGEHIAELTFSKWAKETTYEAIKKHGYDEAVYATDKQFIKDIQKTFRKSLFDFLKTGTGKDTQKKVITGETMQKCLANLWGNMQVAFESTDATPIVFINPLDVADYLGTATITNTGTVAFGMTYLKNFLGMYDAILSSDVAKGSIIATPQENLHIYYASAGDADGFSFETSDETGYVGVHHVANYDNLTFKTVAASSLTPFCDYLDKIYAATIAPGA